jgi:hypothetical protein
MSMILVTAIWVVLFLAVASLAVVRKWASREEDDSLHLKSAEVALAQKQTALAGYLDRVDRWGKALTIVVVVYGLALLVRVLYQGWVDSGLIK